MDGTMGSALKQKPLSGLARKLFAYVASHIDTIYIIYLIALLVVYLLIKAILLESLFILIIVFLLEEIYCT